MAGQQSLDFLGFHAEAEDTANTLTTSLYDFSSLSRQNIGSMSAADLQSIVEESKRKNQLLLQALTKEIDVHVEYCSSDDDEGADFSESESGVLDDDCYSLASFIETGSSLRRERSESDSPQRRSNKQPKRGASPNTIAALTVQTSFDNTPESTPSFSSTSTPSSITLSPVSPATSTHPPQFIKTPPQFIKSPPPTDNFDDHCKRVLEAQNQRIVQMKRRFLDSQDDDYGSAQGSLNFLFPSGSSRGGTIRPTPVKCTSPKIVQATFGTASTGRAQATLSSTVAAADSASVVESIAASRIVSQTSTNPNAPKTITDAYGALGPEIGHDIRNGSTRSDCFLIGNLNPLKALRNCSRLDHGRS